MLVKHLDNHERFANHQPCHWNFNSSSTPPFGRLWEATIRSTKTLLTRVKKTHHFTLEERSTVLCRIESVFNSRSLAPMSSSLLDFAYLPPDHFLIDQLLIAVPELAVQENITIHLRKWKLLHQCLQVFWCWWSSEYLCSLQTKSK